jgi:hypothetical protein
LILAPVSGHCPKYPFLLGWRESSPFHQLHTEERNAESDAVVYGVLIRLFKTGNVLNCTHLAAASELLEVLRG